MEWVFGDFALSEDRAELSGPDGPVHVERQPLDLLFLLARNAGRVVTKDEIVEIVWNGRFVSDATVSTAVKQARRAVGDDGTRQAVIKTVHGRGFRFVAEIAAPATVSVEVRAVAAAPAEPEPRALPPVGSAQASIAVLRFQFLGTDPGSGIGEAIPAELISALSRLGWLHVIARGSSFRFEPSSAVPEDIAAQLGVRYILTGIIEAIGDMLTISTEVLSAADGNLIWTERFATTAADIHVARSNIVASTIAALELHVPRYEGENARRLTPAQFDAWSHYHLGLRHMYRFNRPDNLVAAEHFARALEHDPEFARAHAGLSFTSWQSAFMHFGDDRRLLLGEAAASAARALEIDGHDPFANFCMGRARWLEGDVDAGMGWMERALLVNPNFAQCHYTMGLSNILNGRPVDATAYADKAIGLSPLDPLLYAMLSTKALASMTHEDFETAGAYIEQAVQVPGAHFYISIIAAAAFEVAGRKDRAEHFRARALAMKPDLTSDMFFQAFPFAEGDLRNTLQGALRRLGID